MSSDKYQCRQCLTNFTGKESLRVGDEVRCPQCQSADVKKIDEANKTIEFLRNIMYSGGG